MNVALKKYEQSTEVALKKYEPAIMKNISTIWKDRKGNNLEG